MDIDDIEDNELLQFTVYHNSKNKPHLPVAHMDLDIATLREHLDRSGEEMIKFHEKFLGLNIFLYSLTKNHTFSWGNHRFSDFDGGRLLSSTSKGGECCKNISKAGTQI